MVILDFILNFSFFLCSFLPEASCAKKLAHCGKSCFALLAVRLPGNSALQNKENFYYKSSMPQTVLPALTARCAHNGLDHNLRLKPCILQITAEFHENGIDILMGSMRIDYSSRTYDTEGFTAHWEDLADERNAATSRRRVCLRYRQAMQSIAF